MTRLTQWRLTRSLRAFVDLSLIGLELLATTCVVYHLFFRLDYQAATFWAVLGVWSTVERRKPPEIL